MNQQLFFIIFYLFVTFHIILEHFFDVTWNCIKIPNSDGQQMSKKRTVCQGLRSN